MPNDRQPYYDHEPAYRRVAETGGRGWDDHCINPDGDSYAALDAFLATLPTPPAGCRALALGCGGGQDALRLASKGYAVTGVDYSPTAIELARRNAADASIAIAFEVGDCLDLAGVEGAEMDLVIDNHVLHCMVGIDDRQAFLASVRRVLKPGGMFFCTTMSREGDYQPETFGANPRTHVAKGNNRYWVGEAELLGELNGARLQVSACQRRTTNDGSGDELQIVAVR